jgi:hypothetical protein
MFVKPDNMHEGIVFFGGEGGLSVGTMQYILCGIIHIVFLLKGIYV